MRVRHASSSWRESGRNSRERRLAAAAAAERPAREDQRGIERERAEQAVDVVGDAERGAAGMRVERRNQPVGRGLEHGVLVLGQEAQHGSGESYGSWRSGFGGDLAQDRGQRLEVVRRSSCAQARRRLVDHRLDLRCASCAPFGVSATVRTRRSVGMGPALGEAVLLEPVDEPGDVRGVALPRAGERAHRLRRLGIEREERVHRARD